MPISFPIFTEFYKTLTDVSSITDLLNKQSQISKIEAVQSADNLFLSFQHSPFTETFTATDLLFKQVLKENPETINFTDFIAKSIKKPIQNVAHISDALFKHSHIEKQETINQQDFVTKTIYVDKYESMHLTDTINILKIFLKTLIDAIELYDTKQSKGIKSFSEAITLFEMLHKRIQLTQEELVSLIDVIVKDALKTLDVETSEATDLVVKAMKRLPTELISLNDVISKDGTKEFTDTSSLQDLLFRSISRILETDIVESSDFIIKISKKLPIEVLSLIDLVARSQYKMIEDSIILVPIITKQIPKTFEEQFTLSDVRLSVPEVSYLLEADYVTPTFTKAEVITPSFAQAELITPELEEATYT